MEKLYQQKNKTQVKELVIEALKKKDIKSSDIEKIAEKTSQLYGKQHFLRDIHNYLKDNFDNSIILYDTIKPLFSKAELEMFANTPNTLSKTEINNEIQKTLSMAEYSNDVIRIVASLVSKLLDEPNYKQIIYEALVTDFGQEEAVSIYHHIQKILKLKKKD
jgi:hypothetical protein